MKQKYHHDGNGHVDLKPLWQMIGVNEIDTMRNFIDSFLASAEERMETMQKAIATEDIYRIELEAHTLKSSSRNFGANTLSRYCQQLENEAHCGMMPVVTSLLEQVETEYHHVRTALEEIQQNLQQ